jgi:hypothetical protein
MRARVSSLEIRSFDQRRQIEPARSQSGHHLVAQGSALAADPRVHLGSGPVG